MKCVCPHCKTDLKLDEKTGALECPRCKCIFRLVLVRWNAKCYQKHYPEKGVIKKVAKKKRTRRKSKKPKSN